MKKRTSQKGERRNSKIGRRAALRSNKRIREGTEEGNKLRRPEHYPQANLKNDQEKSIEKKRK